LGVAALHVLLVSFTFSLRSVKIPISQQLGEIFEQSRCHFNIAPMVVKMVRLLARRIRDAREGVRKSREDLIAKRGLGSIGVRRKPLKNISGNEFRAAFTDGCDGRQRSLNLRANKTNSQDTINSKTYGCSG
jgi:hypothetical protein